MQTAWHKLNTTDKCLIFNKHRSFTSRKGMKFPCVVCAKPIQAGDMYRSRNPKGGAGPGGCAHTSCVSHTLEQSIAENNGHKNRKKGITIDPPAHVPLKPIKKVKVHHKRWRELNLQEKCERLIKTKAVTRWARRGADKPCLVCREVIKYGEQYFPRFKSCGAHGDNGHTQCVNKILRTEKVQALPDFTKERNEVSGMVDDICKALEKLTSDLSEPTLIERCAKAEGFRDGIEFFIKNFLPQGVK